MLKLDNEILGLDRHSTSTVPTNFADYDLFSRKYWFRELGQFVDLVQQYGPDQILKNISKPILLSAASDPFQLGYAHEFLQQHQLLDKITAVLVNDWSLVKSNQYPIFRFFPTLIYRFHKRFSKVEYPVDFDKRNYKLSCLNRAPKLHRALTFCYLSQYPWFDQVRFSFFGMDSTQVGNMPQQTCQEEFLALTGEAGKKWLDRQTFPISIPGDTPWENMSTLGCHNPYTPSYVDTYANLCTESHHLYLTLTEKSVKPIAAGNLLWMVSAPQHMEVLTKLGFNLHYGDADYGTYDQIANPVKRIIACVENLNRYYDQLPDLWYTNRKKLIDNRNWLFSPGFGVHLKSYIKDLL